MSSKSRAGRIETHLSTWMNGESAIKKSKLRAPRSAQNPLPGKKIHLVPGSTVHLDGYAMRSAPTPLPRSADLHSPTNFSRPLASDQWHSPQQPYLHPAFASPVATNAPCDALSKHRRRHRKEKTRAHRSGICGMKSNDPRIQSKGIGTIVSGTVLAVVLSVCKYSGESKSQPPDYLQIWRWLRQTPHRQQHSTQPSYSASLSLQLSSSTFWSDCACLYCEHSQATHAINRC